MKVNSDLFDISNYAKTHELHSERNKKVIRKFKDELEGEAMDEVCALRSEVYSYRAKNSVTKKLKGSKNVF